jgi:hypothetical protein
MYAVVLVWNATNHVNVLDEHEAAVEQVDLACTREVCSNLGRNTGYSGRGFVVFFSPALFQSLSSLQCHALSVEAATAS